MVQIRKLWKRLLIALVVLPLAVASNDALRLNPAQEVAAAYTYDLVEWHAANLLSKWVHRVAAALPWNSESEGRRRQRVADYFALGVELARITSELARAAAQTGEGPTDSVARLELERQQVRDERRRLRDDVEETLEATISAVVSTEGLGLWGGFIFPPVDIRLTEPPKLLVTSPRDRILRTYDVLLRPDVRLYQREEMEERLLRESDLSALVLDIGGVATYPASLPNTQPLQWTLRASAHEWLHHYFFFRPLGQSMFKNSEMQSLNETAADIAGRELGDMAFEMLGGVLDSPPQTAGDGTKGHLEDPLGYDFNREMRKTRVRVDSLLAEGKIEEAEAYMEERRRFFVENGQNIRKLNQAYFAFYGTYAEGPASVSPIGDQLREFRDLMPGPGVFIKAISGVSNYPQFLERLEELKKERRTD